MNIKVLKKKFCEVVTKEIFAQYRGVKYATKIKFDSDLSIQDFCSQVLKSKEFDKLKADDKVEYVLKDNYLYKKDPVVPLSFLTKETQPFMIFEDSYSPRVLEERNLSINEESFLFQSALNGFTKDLDVDYKLDSPEIERERKIRLNNETNHEFGKSYKEMVKEVESEKNLPEIDPFNKSNSTETRLEELVQKVENDLVNQIKFEPLLPEQNMFNLPIKNIQTLTRNGQFLSNKEKMQQIMDIIFTQFALTIEDEFPLFLEFNPVVKPINHASKPVPFYLLNRSTGKIFPFTFALMNNEVNMDLENHLYITSIDSLHTLKKVSRSRHNDINSVNYGIVTNLLNWKITMFERPEKNLYIEESKHLNISRTYKVAYNKETNSLDMVKLTEILKLIRRLMKDTNDDLAEERRNSDERWKDAANFMRKVKI
jgi:hypothetical protein